MPKALVVLISLMVVLTACTVTRADVVEDLLEVGLDQDSADCVYEHFVAQGFEPDDAVGIVSSEATEAIAVGIESCYDSGSIDGGEIARFSDEDDLRDVLFEELEDFGLTDSQAQCVVDAYEAEGFTMVDLSIAGFDDEEGGSAVDALSAATVACSSDR